MAAYIKKCLPGTGAARSSGYESPYGCRHTASMICVCSTRRVQQPEKPEEGEEHVTTYRSDVRFVWTSSGNGMADSLDKAFLKCITSQGPTFSKENLPVPHLPLRPKALMKPHDRNMEGCQAWPPSEYTSCLAAVL